MRRAIIALAVAFAAVSAHAQYVMPYMGGGQLSAPMLHTDVTFDGGNIGLHVDDSVPTPVLNPLIPPLEFDPAMPWSVLGYKAYNYQYAWNAGGFITLPPGGSIWVERLSQDPEIEVYLRPGWTEIFATDGERWKWSGVMQHNAYAVLNPIKESYSANYRVYIGDSTLGVPMAGYGSAEVTWTWNPPTLVWTGDAGGDENWTSAANWGGATPVGGEQLRFGPLAGGHTGNFNDIDGPFQFNRITFTVDAPSYDLKGKSIKLIGPVVNQSDNNQTIGLNIELAYNGGTFDTGAKDLLIAGSIGGIGSLIKQGAGTLTLAAAPTYTGDAAIEAGLLQINANAALNKISGGSDLGVGNGARLTAASIAVGTLFIDSGASVTIAPLSDGSPLTMGDNILPVPEPSTFALLGMSASVFFAYAWRKQRKWLRCSLSVVMNVREGLSRTFLVGNPLVLQSSPIPRTNIIRRFRLRGWMVLSGVLLASGGCGSPRAEDLSKSPPSPTVAHDNTSVADQTSTDALPADASAEVPDVFKELSAEDRGAAEKQRKCPVSGGLLGSMGKPYKIIVQDQTVFLCCQNCEDAIRKNPDKYLAKLNVSLTK